MRQHRLVSAPLAAAAAGSGFVALAMVSAVAGGFVQPSDARAIGTGGVLGVVGAFAGVLGLAVAQRQVVGDIDQARHDARHDALTGLVNRAELHRELEESLERAARDKTVVGVLFLDLNKFKIVNDTLGHDAGDELLKVVAARLRATIRSTDVVARLGGDEFVVVCRDLIVADSVLNVASQLQRRFREQVALGPVMHEVGASIGIAIALPGDRRTPDDLLRDADAAMYRAKRERLPYNVFDDSQRAQACERVDMEVELNRAIDENQFVLFYQPIVDVIDWRLTGYEALLRWRHPERGLIEPHDFLPIADSVGLMSKIGSTVLLEACAQMAVWNHLTPTARQLRVSVNLAEQQLTDPNLAFDLEERLAYAGLDPSQFGVEVSELMLSRHLEELDALRQVKALGVAVAMDCFGTGGLPLRHARSASMVSTLKIDRSFVRDFLHDPVARASIEAIVALARPLGLSVLAEGVESAEQMESLAALGIRLMQGYLFNAPDYADVVDPGSWFETWSDQQEASLGYLPANAGR